MVPSSKNLPTKNDTSTTASPTPENGRKINMDTVDVCSHCYCKLPEETVRLKNGNRADLWREVRGVPSTLLLLCGCTAQEQAPNKTAEHHLYTCRCLKFFSISAGSTMTKGLHPTYPEWKRSCKAPGKRLQTQGFSMSKHSIMVLWRKIEIRDRRT